MQFLWPGVLWLLLLVPALIAAYVYAQRRRKRHAVSYASLRLVRDAIGPGQKIRRHVPPFLVLVALTVAIVAVARPTAYVTLPSEYLTLVLAMDVSRSMQASDVNPNRLTAAQVAAKQFIEDLPRHVRVGIVSFAGTASVVQTPTESHEDLFAAIDRFELQRGTATGSGLILALATLFPDAGIDLESAVYDSAFSRWGGGAAPIDRPRKASKPEKEWKPVAPGSYTAGAIIMLSDGRRTTGPDPLEAAKMAADRGVRIYTVGLGTKDGSLVGFEGYSFFAVLDEDTLKQVAKITGGEYFNATTAADLQKVYSTLSLQVAMERKQTEIGALLSAAAALLILVAALLSLRWFHRVS